MRFQVFKKEHWSEVSQGLPSTERCLKELQKRYTELSDAEKRKIVTPHPHQKQRYCICEQQYDPYGPMMVQCNICKDWYHSSCIGMEDGFLTNKIPRYHCATCADRIFRGMTQYISHHDDRIDDIASHVIKELGAEFDSLDLDVQMLIRGHHFATDTLKGKIPSSNLLGHDRGIKNENINCWISAITHILCGTGIADLLLSYNGSKEQDISKLLSFCRIRLAKDVRSPLTLRMIQDLGIKFAELGSQETRFDPRTGGHRDASEFYSSIITYYFENILSDMIMNDFQFACMDLRHCLNCNGVAGSIHRNTMFNVAVIDSEAPIDLTDLIWAQLRGKHYEGDEYKKSVCHPRCKSPSVWEASFINNFPSVLPIQLKRASWGGTGRIVQTPIALNRSID